MGVFPKCGVIQAGLTCFVCLFFFFFFFFFFFVFFFFFFFFCFFFFVFFLCFFFFFVLFCFLLFFMVTYISLIESDPYKCYLEVLVHSAGADFIFSGHKSIKSK